MRVSVFIRLKKYILAIGLAAACCVLPQNLTAHMISSNFDCAWYGVDIAGPKSLRGDLTTEEKIMRVAAKLPSVKGSDGTTIFPAGTTIDRTDVTDGFLNLWITFPAGVTEGSLDGLVVYQGGEVLRHYFADSENLQGHRIFARSAGQDEYKSLEAFVFQETPGVPSEPVGHDYVTGGPGPQPDPDYEAWYEKLRQEEPQKNLAGQSSFGGSGMPNGALAGRVIFTYGGHGRTWDGTSGANGAWRWQRGYSHGMQEDFGNVDGSDAYAYYCFNAGATVVSFRPIGYQDKEVVIDNTSPGFSVVGAWNNNTDDPRYYGSGAVRYRWANTANTETATATYTPNIPEAGYYPVYTWANYGADRVPGQLYRVRSTGGESQVRIDHRRVGCGWIYLGTYYFEAGSNPATGSVVISNMNPPSLPAGSYIAVADAIRFGNGMGNVNNGGGISGWSRREESTVYWIQNGWGNGNTAGTWSSTQVWNNSNASDDENLSWSAPPRMAAQMYRVHSDTTVLDKRYALYLGWHSNASSGGARGSVGLITGSPTTNQAWWAAKTSNELDAASGQEAGNWEHSWFNRASATYTGGYGEITNSYLESKMDATIIEVAYHDNQQDAELLRDPRVRNVHGKACYRAAVQYFNNFRGGPLAYLPEPPTRFRAVNQGNGSVSFAWAAGPTGGSKGQAPTSYRLYHSNDGLGWGASTVVNGTAHTLHGLTPGQVIYFRVTGVNAGGESFPSDALAVRVSTGPKADVLVVNGYDRIDRNNNIPRGGHPQQVDQLIHRRNNSYDYIRQHARAIDAAEHNFDSAMNEAIINSDINLNDYQVVVWILGEESNRDNTLLATERTKIDAFLAAGRNLFISGADTGYDLDGLNKGRTFYRNSLRGQYSANASNSYVANGAPGSIFAGITDVAFPPTDVMYDVDSADVITAVNGSQVVMNYAPVSPITDAFDSLGTWHQPSFSGSTTADSSTFQIVANPRRQGTGSGDIYYDFTLGSVMRLYNSGGATFSNASTFGIWVYGDNSGHSLRVLLRDTVDEELFQKTPITINFTGWHHIVWNLATDSYTRFAGSGDNQLSGNMRLDSIYMVQTPGQPVSAHIYIDEATATSGAPVSPGPAAVQYSGNYKLINLAFPFEAIDSVAKRDQIMINAMSFLAPLSDPTNLQGEVTLSGINISWDDNAEQEDGYYVERKRDDESEFTVVATLPASNTEYSDTNGLEPGREYCYRVRAYKDSSLSEYTNTICLTTANPSEEFIGEAENPGTAGDHFGFSIAKIATSTKQMGFVVGAPGTEADGKLDVGKAYVFFPPSLMPAYVIENPAPIPDSESSYFGYSVGSVGTSILIGAPGRETTFGAEGGRVYMFNALDGSFQRSFVSPDSSVGDRFGEAVSGMGKNDVVVGAPGINSIFGHLPDPKVYVFNLKKGTVQTIDDSSDHDRSSFGHAVAGGKGKIGIVRQTDQLCTRGELEIITKRGKLFAATPDAHSVADANGKFLVGAPLHLACPPGTETSYSYLVAGKKVKMVWTSPEGAANDAFGFAGAGGKKFVGIGAPQTLDSGKANAGRAYLFRMKSNEPAFTYNNPVPNANDRFGHAVSLLEKVKLPTKEKQSFLAIGAPYTDSSGDGYQSGAVYFYEFPLK